MTASSPIPLDAFLTELESLDSDAFATLVGETYAATAEGVDVDPPRVTVRQGDRRTDLLVVSAATEGFPADSVDAVAVASDALLDGLDSGLDAEVVTPADLRERLLYAVPPAEANAIADRILGVPVRSAAYEGAAGSAADGGDDGERDETDADAPADRDETDADAPADRDETDEVPVTSADSRPRSRPTDSTDASRPNDGTTTTESADPGAPGDRRSPRTALAAVAVAALLVAAAGAGFAAGSAGLGGPDALAGGGDGPTDQPATDADEGGSTNGSDGGSDGSTGGGDPGDTVAVADGDPTGEAARNTALSPTCERSALQVVQIQMNALRYNDAETNDGIRTLRAFASPENREIVGSTGQYVELFETERYAPMLTYDTARYSVPESADGAAEVEVVTRENGSVTGRYEFRLVRVGGGTGATDTSLGDVDDCWMTDAVGAPTE
ncbi:MAG: hypothetical protein ACQERM_10955 [Methanobacteriota archaeon]